MKLYALSTELQDVDALRSEYKSARQIGVLRLGEMCLYFRKGLRAYYIPYADIRRCFRRVLLVPAKMCCGKGELQVENLVVCSDAGEIAQIQLPGTKAAKVLIDELKAKLPDVDFTRPAKERKETGE